MCGFCWGGVLAFKIASDMRKMGYSVKTRVMSDSASKAKRRKKAVSKGYLKRDLKNRIADMKAQLKPLSNMQRLQTIIRKILRIPIYFIEHMALKLYWYSSRKDRTFLLRISKVVVALRYAYNRYKPDKYEGKVHFIKATGYREVRNRNEYWEDRSGEFEFHAIECRHLDLIRGGSTKELVEMISSIMEDEDA